MAAILLVVALLTAAAAAPAGRLEQEYLADQRTLAAAECALAARLYWTLMAAVESLPEAARIGAREPAESAILALSAARKALGDVWSESAPTAAAQRLDQAQRAARLLELAAKAAPALDLEERARWIGRSASEARRDIPRSASRWAQTRELISSDACRFTRSQAAAAFDLPAD